MPTSTTRKDLFIYLFFIYIKKKRLFCSNLHWRAYNTFTKIKIHRHKEEEDKEEDHSIEIFFFFGGEKLKSRNLKLSLSPCMEGGDGMEWKEIKRIILEYSSLPLFWSFNWGNRKSIPLFGTLKWERMKWLKGNTHSSLFPQNLKFSFSQNWEELELYFVRF